MNKEWDSFKQGRLKNYNKQPGGKIGTNPGEGADFSARMAAMPNVHQHANPRCTVCNHYQYSGTPCKCSQPKWKLDHSTRDTFISFMTEVFTEALRVLRPGGHAFVWALPRTSHWTALALEDAGFEIRDSIAHMFGSGFPKSLDVSKAIDKRGGASIGWFGPWLRQEREMRGIAQKELATHFPSKTGGMTGCIANWELGLNTPTPEQFNKLCEVLDLPFERLEEAEREVIGHNNRTKGWFTAQDGHDITTPATDMAKKYAGWGSALKPSHETWWLCRKPLAEPSIAANVLKYSTGALNIDISRIGVSHRQSNPAYEIPHNVDADTLCAWLGIPLFDDSHSVALSPLACALKRISSVLHSSSTAYTSPLHDEDVQGDTLPSRALCESLHGRLYPNGVWCGLSLRGLLSFQGDCPACSHFCDVQSHVLQEAALVSPASLADALECMSLEMSEREHTRKNQCICHPSNLDVAHLVVSLIRSLTGFTDYTTYSTRPSSDRLVRPAISRSDNQVYGKGLGKGTQVEPQGRFPANTLLSHSWQCVPLGVKRVRGTAPPGKPSRGTADPNTRNAYGKFEQINDFLSYTDSEGMEQVEAFQCAEDCPIFLLDQQSGVRKNGGPNYPGGDRSSMFGNTKVINPTQYAGDKGGASRYFQNFHPDDMPPFLYTSKASRAERSKGCEALPERAAGVKNASGRGFSESDPYRDIKATNNHPTVKPVNLLTYLIRMITPPNGIVLDMFAGSGTTGVAAVQCGFRYILVEQEQEYIDIIHARLAHAHGAAPQEAHSILRETIRRVRTDMEDCTHDWVDLPKESQFKAYCKLCDAFKSVEAQEVEYECAEDCPVRVLGEQSGVRKSGGRVSHVGDVTEREHIYHSHTSQREYEMQGSTGTAARFFQTFPPGSLFEGMEDVNGEQESEQERVT